MKDLVLFTSPMSRRLRERLAPHYDVWGPPERWPQDLPDDDRTRRTRALVTYGAIRTDAAAMDRMPALGLICCYASGFEGIDLNAAAARGIEVCNSPGANGSAVADLALGLLIASVRRIVQGDRFVRDGRWAASEMPPVPGLTGRRVGIFGLGEIGRRIASRCAAFEMEVAYCGRTRHADVPYGYHDSLLSLAEWADVLVVAVRAGPANRHAVNADVLRALGKGGHVVNITRGSVIDEAALVRALEADLIAGAGLDVFEGEPAVNPALLRLPQVVVTPHIGGGTYDAHVNAQGMILDNLDAFFAGRAVPHRIGATA